MVVTAEKAGPKVVSILVWRENAGDLAPSPKEDRDTHRSAHGQTLLPMFPCARARTQGHITNTPARPSHRSPGWGGDSSGSRGAQSHEVCSYRGCGVCGGKVDRAPREAVVAGLLAGAHALEGSRVLRPRLLRGGRGGCRGRGFRDGGLGPCLTPCSGWSKMGTLASPPLGPTGGQEPAEWAKSLPLPPACPRCAQP